MYHTLSGQISLTSVILAFSLVCASGAAKKPILKEEKDKDK